MSHLSVTAKQQAGLAIAIYILWVVSIAYLGFNQEKRELYQSLDQQLEIAARTVPLLLPNTFHHQNMTKDDLTQQADYRNILTLSKYTDKTDFKYIYTLILRDDKVVMTSSSGTMEERVSDEGLRFYFDQYDDVDPRVFDVFTTLETTFLEYNDQWGSFRSVFIPQYAADGSIYLAAADLAIDPINDLIQETLYQAIIVALLFLFAAYPIYFIATRRINLKAIDLEQQVLQQSQALTKNQQRLEHALSSSKQAWSEINVQTGDIIVSDKYSRLLGIDPANNKSKFATTIQTWKDNIHPDDLDKTMDLFWQSVNSDEPVSLEFRRKTADGSWIWIHSTGRVTERDQEGKPLLVTGMNVNITERKRNELVLQALAETNASSDGNIFKTIARQLALSHNMRYVFISKVNANATQATTIVLWANGRFINNFTYDLEGTPCEGIINEKAEIYPENIQELFPLDHLLVDMNAESYIGVPLKNEKNEVLGLIAMVDDKPMKENNNTLPLLNSVAVRASIELQRRKDYDALLISSHIFRDTLESIIVVNNENDIVDVNPAFCKHSGLVKEELVGQSVSFFRTMTSQTPELYEEMKQSVVRHGHWKGEISFKNQNGNNQLLDISITQILDSNNKPTYRFILLNDITEKRQQQDALKFMAHYDELTKLPNRTLFADRFHQAAAHSKRSNTLLAVCFLDLDNFKLINDNYGHKIGDQLLLDVANRITTSLREDDTVSRQGGDEFTLLLGAIDSYSQCQQLLLRVLNALSKPYSINNQEHHISASIGVTLYPLDDSDLDTLTRHADQAMYEAKLSGKNQYHLFNTLNDQQIVHKQNKLQEIRYALNNNQLQLYYQPKVNMKSGQVYGAEALIRWIHPERGLIPPLDFLPLVENTSLENDIGNWVINEALNQLTEWSQQGINLEVSVNIASYHLQSPNFIKKLEKALTKNPVISPQSLQLEILESSALTEVDIISAILKTCQEKLGVSIALDDFGTGYSSLTHLRNLPAETIKIDRTFVHDLLDDPNDFAIIDGIIGLADAFNRTVIAEGVETTDDGLMLLAMGCHNAQGYGVSKPMPADELPDWLTTYTPNPRWLECGSKSHSPQQQKIKFIRLTTKRWFNKIERTVHSIDNDHPSATVTLCHLGFWVEQLRSAQLFDDAWLNETHHLHDELFTLGEKVLAARSENQQPLVDETFTQLDLTFEKLMTLLDNYH